jgi:tetratricopeptide (TPR) repeat protein
MAHLRADESGALPRLYIAQELVSGETLAHRVRRGPLAVEEVVRLGAQAAEALAAAHARGVVHRDIKPSNLMLSEDGRIKVLDFGVAKHLVWAGEPKASEEDMETWSRTAAGIIVGTPAYMAPEQIAGDAVDARADVYALGCVLYEALAGCPPFTGASTAEVLRRSLTEVPRPLDSIRPDVPPALAEIVTRALDRDPSGRHASGGELARALRATGMEALSTVRSSSVPRPASRRIRKVLVGTLLAALIGAGAWYALERAASPALAFKERDFVLVTDPLNETGEPVFDVALKRALETDLRQSRYVNVLDSARVEDALRMMRRPTDSVLDEELGREVCLRTGARGLVVPGILRAGAAYQLRAALVEPSTSRVVSEVRVTARGREEVLLSAIDELTREVRRRLGESLDSIARTDPPFAQYTTSSLEALDLLGRGQRAWGAGDAAGAERAFREALQYDPRFATARGSLGLLLIQHLHDPEEGRRMLTRALEDATEVSQREYLLLRAAHRTFVAEDPDGALDDYRFISELYPDDMVPYNNSGRILLEQKRFEEAAAMFERAHRVAPQSAVPLWNLYFLSVQHLRDPVGAERAARGLLAVLPDNAHAAHMLAWSFVMQRRFAEAEDGMRATLEINSSHAWALPNLGHLLLRRGAADEAVEVYQEVLERAGRGMLQTDAAHVSLCLGLALRAAGREAEVRPVVETALRALAARSGERTPAEQALRAALLAVGGRASEARGLLGPLMKRERPSANLWFSLARAWAVLGERERALTCLERAAALGYDDMHMILVGPSFASIRDDPAVERLAPRRPVPGS